MQTYLYAVSRRFVFLVLVMLASVAGAGVTPLLNKNTDVEQPMEAQELIFKQASSQELRWQFYQGTNIMTLTNGTNVVFSFSPPSRAYYVSVTGSLYNATSGMVSTVFTPTQLNTNSKAGTFDWQLNVSDTTSTLAYAYGKLTLLEDLIASARAAGMPAVSNIIYWNRYSGYSGTATSGPYRAGTSITFSTNADGSCNINASLSTNDIAASLASHQGLTSTAHGGIPTTNGLASISYVDGATQGLATASITNAVAGSLSSHQNLTGASVHGLGSASTNLSGDFYLASNPSGYITGSSTQGLVTAAVTNDVAGSLSSHQGLTSTAHGGIISTNENHRWLGLNIFTNVFQVFGPDWNITDAAQSVGLQYSEATKTVTWGGTQDLSSATLVGPIVASGSFTLSGTNIGATVASQGVTIGTLQTTSTVLTAWQGSVSGRVSTAEGQIATLQTSNDVIFARNTAVSNLVAHGSFPLSCIGTNASETNSIWWSSPLDRSITITALTWSATGGTGNLWKSTTAAALSEKGTCIFSNFTVTPYAFSNLQVNILLAPGDMISTLWGGATNPTVFPHY